ncbi:MAG: Maf family protein [Candidatus Peribacteraceae bacterium]|nr:Maf family protein [Candidatus Peribacteraceae bacterium]
MKIILASSSPRRAELLRRIVGDFEIKSPELVETLDLQKSTAENCERLAVEKARSVFEKNSITIGSDTLGELAGKIFGKPRSKSAAIEFLRKLSGKTHQVISAYCVKTDDQEIIGHAITSVAFRELHQAEIEKYVAGNPVEQFAAAYAIQGSAKSFVKSLEGTIETVIGLPLTEIQKVLGDLGVR